MNGRTEEKLEELRLALKEDPRFSSLASLDEKVSASEEVQALAKAKDKASEEYEDSLNHAGNEAIIIEKRKALFAAKLALDSHPLIQEYNAAYSACKDLLVEIDDLLFSEFRKNPFAKEGKQC